LASNIANADTPNYKARDIDFNSALKEALSNSAAPGTLAKTAVGHIGGTNANTSAGGVPLLYRTTAQGNVDGNTVDMEVERNQFTDNALRYETSITLMGAQIKGLLAAIQG
jgi:flagellar basal-body rod protein FlgB